MQVRRYLWLMSFFLGLWLTACAGGSGSSGFDSFPSSENAAIEQALNEQTCVPFHGLSICPADTALPGPPPSPTATPTAIVISPQPTPTANALETPLPTASSTRTPTATPQVNPPHKPRIDTGISDDVPCASVAAGGDCMFVVPFAPDGFPADATYRVAVRALNPMGAWVIGSDLTSSGSPPAPAFDAPVSVEVPDEQSDQPRQVQVAVLVYVEPQPSVPMEVDALADSGADYAFVTAPVTLELTPRSP